MFLHQSVISPQCHRPPENAREVVSIDRSRSSGEQPLLLERSFDEVVDVGLAETHGADAVGDADVAHQGDEDTRQ